MSILGGLFTMVLAVVAATYGKPQPPPPPPALPPTVFPIMPPLTVDTELLQLRSELEELRALVRMISGPAASGPLSATSVATTTMSGDESCESPCYSDSDCSSAFTSSLLITSLCNTCSMGVCVPGPSSGSLPFNNAVTVCGSPCVSAADCLGSECLLCRFGSCTAVNETVTRCFPTFVEEIRGVAYSPTPVGDVPTFMTPFGDYFTEEYSYLYKRDLPLIKEMGANTIRLYWWNSTGNHSDFLNFAHELDLKVIATYPLPIPSFEDLHNPEYLERVKDGFAAMVQAHSAFPAILYWMVGNELNAPGTGSLPTSCTTDLLMLLIEEMSQIAHAIEGAECHPVSTALADVGDIIAIMGAYQLDVWSVNLYRGCYNFTGFWAELQAFLERPSSLGLGGYGRVVVSEFGVDAYNELTGGEYEDTQATCALSLWTDLVLNSNLTYGGTLMEWSDEWWKGMNLPGSCQHPDCSATSVNNTAFRHSRCGFPDTSSPDLFKNEGYWGIMRYNDSNPLCMNMRSVYNTLRSNWTGNTEPVECSPTVGLNMSCCVAPMTYPRLSLSSIDGSEGSPPPKPPCELLPSRNVTIANRRLYIDYEVTQLKAIYYSPTPIGANPQTTPPYGDYFRKTTRYIYDRDLPLLKFMGANTVVAQLGTSTQHRDFLDAAYAHGLYVIVQFYIPTNIALNNQTASDLVYDFEELVRFHKSHPAVIMWMVGGAVNIDFQDQLSQVFFLISQLRKSLVEVEGYFRHPLAVGLGKGVPNLWSTVSTYDNVIDIWSIAVYEGESFYDLFHQFYLMSGSPLLTMFGMGAYVSTTSPPSAVATPEGTVLGAAVQAAYVANLWVETAQNTQVCVGGVVFDWSDEWWRGTAAQVGGVACGGGASAAFQLAACGEGNLFMPDGFLHQQFMGIMSQSLGEDGSSFCLTPRPLFWHLRCAWISSPTSECSNVGVAGDTAAEAAARLCSAFECCATPPSWSQAVTWLAAFSPMLLFCIAWVLYYWDWRGAVTNVSCHDCCRRSQSSYTPSPDDASSAEICIKSQGSVQTFGASRVPFDELQPIVKAAVEEALSPKIESLKSTSFSSNNLTDKQKLLDLAQPNINQVLPEKRLIGAVRVGLKQVDHLVELMTQEVDRLRPRTKEEAGGAHLLTMATCNERSKLLENYFVWVERVKPFFKGVNWGAHEATVSTDPDDVQAILGALLDYLVVWEVAESLRHCPEAIPYFFHQGWSIKELVANVFFLGQRMRQGLVEPSKTIEPEFSYDDFNDVFLSADVTNFDTLKAVVDKTPSQRERMFPEQSGLFLSVLANFWYVLHFKALVFPLISITQDIFIQYTFASLCSALAVIDAVFTLLGSMLHFLQIYGSIGRMVKAAPRRFAFEGARCLLAGVLLVSIAHPFFNVELAVMFHPGPGDCDRSHIGGSFAAAYLVLRFLVLFVWEVVVAECAFVCCPSTRLFKRGSYLPGRTVPLIRPLRERVGKVALEVFFWAAIFVIECAFVYLFVEPNTVPAVLFLCGTSEYGAHLSSLETGLKCWAPRVAIVIASLLGYLVFTYVAFVALGVLLGTASAYFFKRLSVYKDMTDLENVTVTALVRQVFIPTAWENVEKAVYTSPRESTTKGKGEAAQMGSDNGGGVASTSSSNSTTESIAGGSAAGGSAAASATGGDVEAGGRGKEGGKKEDPSWPYVNFSCNLSRIYETTTDKATMLLEWVLATMYNDDILTRAEAQEFLAKDGSVKGHVRSKEARRRLLHFFSTLATRTGLECTLDDLTQIPSITILIPVYNESILLPFDGENSLLSDTFSDAIDTGVEHRVCDLKYLTLNFAHEWANFHARLVRSKEHPDCRKSPHELIDAVLNKEVSEENNPELVQKIRVWASMRGQTLFRTVKGANEVVLALTALCALAGMESSEVKALVKSKVQILVSHQTYLHESEAGTATGLNIAYLRKYFPHVDLVLFSDFGAKNSFNQKNNTPGHWTSFWGGGEQQPQQAVMRYGPLKIAQGKAENQNGTKIFAKGECMQTLDMNQENYFEEALKTWFLLQRIFKNVPTNSDGSATTVTGARLVGFREYVFSERLSAVGRFMGNAEWSFGTVVQRYLAFLGVRLHYGHPDVWDGYWAKMYGLSKASFSNTAEDIFAGYELKLREELIEHFEFIQVGKGRESGFANATTFESKLAGGAGLQCKTPAVYLLNRSLRLFPRLSLLYGSVGFYINNSIMTYSIWILMYATLMLSLTGHSAHQIGTLGSALAVEWFIQLGYVYALPLLSQLVVEKGVLTGVPLFVRDLPLSTLFWVWQMRTKTYFFGLAVVRSQSSWLNTGRGLGLQRSSLREIYVLYGQSHFHYGLSLLYFLTVYYIYDPQAPIAKFLKTWTVVLTCVSLLLAPVIFNPTRSFASLGKDVEDLFAFLERTATSWKDLPSEDTERKAKIARSWRLKWIESYVNDWTLPGRDSNFLKWRLRLFVGLVLRTVPWLVICGVLMIEQECKPLVLVLLLAFQTLFMNAVLVKSRERFHGDVVPMRALFFVGLFFVMVSVVRHFPTLNLRHIMTAMILLVLSSEWFIFVCELVLQLTNKATELKDRPQLGVSILNFLLGLPPLPVLYQVPVLAWILLAYTTSVLTCSFPLLHMSILYNESIARAHQIAINRSG